MKKIIFCSMFLILLGIVSYADEDEPVTKQKSTSEVVLTQEDFKKNNCQNVGDALKCISGVYVKSEGEISLRDVSSDKVVVILDGQRLNTSGIVGVNVAAISIENIEKIELLRGGRSAQYGADAVGGVIVITTKAFNDTQSHDQKSKNLNFDVKATYGSYNREILNISNMFNQKNFNYILSYRRELWDGDFEYTNDQGQRVRLGNNHQSSYDIFFKAGLNFSKDQTITASTDFYKANNGSPGLISSLTPTARLRYDNKSYNLTYDKKELFSGFNLKAQTYYHDYNIVYDYDTHSDHNSYVYGLDIQQSGQLFKLINLSYGYNFIKDKIVSTSVGNKYRDTHSAFANFTLVKQFSGFINNFETSLAMRYDYPNDFDPAFSPRFNISMGHNGKFNLGVISHITKSYRAPTFNDLYWPKDSYSIGNPNLVPEVGKNYDVGLTFNMGFLSLTSNYFVNNVNDLIIWEQDPALQNLWTPKNISKTNTKGLENSATLTFFNGMLSLNGEYTYLKAINKSKDVNKYNKYITYRPKNKLDLTTTFRKKNLEANLIYHYTGLRYTNSTNTLWLPSYETIDFNTTYRFNLLKLGWSATFEMTNVTDEDYVKVKDTPEPGRMFKVMLGCSF
ncbi:MAG TPA: TonB-dependent receptor [Candidatus Marinimicrobia bacterium]|nr:TonB-dependent receptor [Candidatus Neomarinimicrobiota bacterium]